MALRLAPEILDPVYVIHPVSKTLAMVYTVMFEFRKIQYLIALVSIRIDDAVWLDLLADDRNQCLALTVRYHYHVDLAISL